MLSGQVRILIVEDVEEDALLIGRELKRAGINFVSQRVTSASDLEAALNESSWQLVISDYSIPGFGGLEALAIVASDGRDIPFILVSGSVGEEKAAEAMRLGARDYVLKDNLTRLSSAVTREITELSIREKRRGVEAEEKVVREKLERLKRFFPADVAERIASGSQADPFKWHRKDVTVLFVDLHGFTSLVELSEPEIVVQILTDYYSRVAKAALEFGGTIGHVAGDGVMVFFNDPLELPNPQEMAVRMGIRLREELHLFQKKWSEMEYSFDFGAGIASGFATVGAIGAEGCWDYSVIGTVTNVAHRLCSLAKNGQILIPQRLVQKVVGVVDATPLGSHDFRGLHDSMSVYNVLGLKIVEKCGA